MPSYPSRSWGVAVLLFTLSCIAVFTQPVQGQINPDNYDSCTLLVPLFNYQFYWRIRNDTIYIGLIANIHGWMGIGISLDGTMDSSGAGSDSIVGWVTESGSCQQGCLGDYWNYQHGQPAYDLTEPGGTVDVHLISAGRNENSTWFEFYRKLVTGDPWDRPIHPDSQMYFIHAICDIYPVSYTSFTQHIPTTNAAALLTLANVSSCVNTPGTPQNNSYTNPQGTYKFSWRLFTDSEGDKIEFTFSAATAGWLALGIGNEQNMYGDIAWGQVGSDGATPQMTDRWALYTAIPPNDAIQNLNPISASYSNGWSTLVVQRLRDTGDVSWDWIIGDTDYIVLWAFSPNKGTPIGGGDYNFDQHTTSNRGLVQVNFVTGTTTTVTPQDNLRKAHGIIMAFTWAVLAIAGFFIGRYYRGSQNQWRIGGYMWVHEHAIIGIGVVIGTIIGFILIVVYISDNGESHFTTAHHIIGLIMFILVFIHPVIGVVAAHTLRKGKEPGWIAYSIGQVHAWLGRVLILLALVNIYLGFAVYCLPAWVFGAFSGLVFAIFVLFVPHEILRWLAPWGGYLGGPGFRYSLEMAERGKPLPKQVRKYMSRTPRQPPLSVKIILWVFQAIVLVVIVGLWIAVAVGIGQKNASTNSDSYSSSCVITQLN
jgi:hypothetical protein